MADQNGGLELPAPTDDTPVGDPALGHLGGFLRAAINRYCATAWAALRPRSGDDALPVRAVFTHDPEAASFNDRDLPALFVWRQRTRFGQRDLDYLDGTSTVRALWVYPPEPQAKHVPRRPFAHAVASAVRVALGLGRIPEWAATGDTDPTAATIAADPDSIRTAFASPTSPTTYSGAQLNGAIGDDTMSPRLGPTITTTAVGSPTYNTTDPVVWTCESWTGATVTLEATLTNPLGGETVGPQVDVRRVISVAVPAQLLGSGTITLGTLGFAGRGSALFQVAGLLGVRLVDWQYQPVQIDVLDADGRVSSRLRYDAVALGLELEERASYDPSTDAGVHTPWGVDFDVTRDDFAASSASLDP